MIHLPDPELLARYDRAAPRYTSYPPVPVWTDTVGPEAYAEALAATAQRPGPLSLYVHLPFCQERCWYCGCNVVIQRSRAAADPYLDALARETERVGTALGSRAVGALHLGGGTPNFLSPPQIRRLFSDLRSAFQVGKAPVDVELDPRHLDTEQLETFAEMGARRVSFGVQDLDPEVGAAIGRPMADVDLRGLLARARAAGVESVNVDLLYGLPLQTPESIRRTALTLLELAPDRVALYGYAHVPWMRPQQRRLERTPLPDAAQRLRLFAAAAGAWLEAGYEWIGMDHFARRDDALSVAARSGTLRRSFQGYTTVVCEEQIGLGVSAIGRVTGLDGAPLWVQNTSIEKTYREGAGLATVRGHRCTPDDQARAILIESILCRCEVTSSGLWARYPETARELCRFAADGLVSLRPDGLDVTPLGRHFLRPIAQTFDAWQAAPKSTPATAAMGETVTAIEAARYSRAV